MRKLQLHEDFRREKFYADYRWRKYKNEQWMRILYGFLIALVIIMATAPLFFIK